MRILSFALAGALAVASFAAATPADAQRHHGNRGWHGGSGFRGGGHWNRGHVYRGNRGWRGGRHYGYRGGYRRGWGRRGLRCRTVWRWGEPQRRCWRAW